MDVGTKCLLVVVCVAASFSARFYIPIFRTMVRDRCAMMRDRYRHFRVRRDRGPYVPGPRDLYGDRVRQILEAASLRAQKISGGYGIDELTQLLSGSRYNPRIWARINVSSRSIIVRIEHAMDLHADERPTLGRIRACFIRECARPRTVRGALAPREFEFERSSE